MGQQKSKEAEHDAVVEKVLTSHLKADQEKLKLLLLGPGESGKSTLFKQANILYGKGFPIEERRDFASVIFGNILGGMSVLAKQSDELQGCAVSRDAVSSKNYFAALNVNDQDSSHLPPEAVEHIKTLWVDEGIQKAWARRAEFQIVDACKIFFDDIERYAASDYIPTDEDVLLCRARTTGIVESNFVLGGQLFNLVDVGGQRSERKKWIRCFGDVLCVVFVASLAGYDETCMEDFKTNRMDEALKLFGDSCNSNWFDRASMVLLLNKRDLFADKIKSSPLSAHFPEYTGGPDYDAGIEFISKQFLAQNRTTAPIYLHITCATDKENARFLFDAVKDTVLNNSLSKAGLC